MSAIPSPMTWWSRPTTALPSTPAASPTVRTRWNDHGGRSNDSGSLISRLTNASSSALPAGAGSVTSWRWSSRSNDSAGTQRGRAENGSSIRIRNRLNGTNRSPTNSRSWSIVNSDPNPSTPVMVMALVGLSMRSQAESGGETANGRGGVMASARGPGVYPKGGRLWGRPGPVRWAPSPGRSRPLAPPGPRRPPRPPAGRTRRRCPGPGSGGPSRARAGAPARR